MSLGIDPRVDFACKRMLGSPDHPAITIHFLNAMMRPAEPLVEVEILKGIQGHSTLLGSLMMSPKRDSGMKRPRERFC